MSGKSFVDTNVLIYLFDQRTPAKQRRAASLLQQLAEEEDAPVISTQVLQETFVGLTRKLEMDPAEALATLQMVHAASFTIQSIDAPLIWRAATRTIQDKLSFWDSLIVEAAREAGCSVLYSEDMQSDRLFDGMKIANPFA
jgi:predicted nucleic acid-binding protein